MKLRELQTLLKETGRYSGRVDGLYGMLTEAGVLLALTDGPDTALIETDYLDAGARLKIAPAAIKAFWKTEANGAGFQAGLPKILPEPHRFSRNTGRVFDLSNPTLSYPVWGSRPYPAKQDDRYRVLLAWIGLLASRDMPIDAAFASASYGAPQIMGENFTACGYPDPIRFAFAMARDEKTQLAAFMSFVTAAGILPALRNVTTVPKSWEIVAAKYNGTGFRKNDYHTKMARAYAAFGGK
jgi:hypothetical protein